MTEQWKPAPGYEGRYEVSDLGRIRSLDRVETFTRLGVPARRRLKGTVLNPMRHAEGYLQVSLRSNGKMKTVRLHRLVGIAFHGTGDPVHNELAHLDGNAGNARADNLAWVTKVENHSHKYLHGTMPRGTKHPNAKLTEDQAREVLRSPGARKELAAKFGVSVYAIDDIRRGKNWAHISQEVARG